MYSVPLPYTDNASDYYRAIAPMPWAIWLDSGGIGHFDILVAQPTVTLVTRGQYTEISTAQNNQHSTEDPFDLLNAQIGNPVLHETDIPFSGGALGYWGYELKRHHLNHAELDTAMDTLPDMAVGIYDWAICIDHQKKTSTLGIATALSRNKETTRTHFSVANK